MNDIMNLFSLNGKNAVVTGANTGLGQGIAVALAAAGAHVFGVARRSCDETAAKIAAEGGQFTEVRADFSTRWRRVSAGVRREAGTSAEPDI